MAVVKTVIMNNMRMGLCCWISCRDLYACTTAVNRLKGEFLCKSHYYQETRNGSSSFFARVVASQKETAELFRKRKVNLSEFSEETEEQQQGGWTEEQQQGGWTEEQQQGGWTEEQQQGGWTEEQQQQADYMNVPTGSYSTPMLGGPMNQPRQ